MSEKLKNLLKSEGINPEKVADKFFKAYPALKKMQEKAIFVAWAEQVGFKVCLN